MYQVKVFYSYKKKFNPVRCYFRGFKKPNLIIVDAWFKRLIDASDNAAFRTQRLVVLKEDYFERI